jgi:hypothetical protein
MEDNKEKLNALIQAKELVLLNEMEQLVNLYQQRVIELEIEVEQKLLEELGYGK